VFGDPSRGRCYRIAHDCGCLRERPADDRLGRATIVWTRPGSAPGIEASGVARPARLYDLRSTFASNSLAAGVTVFELARLMGTSVAMIERHYGTLLEGAGADIARSLSAFEAEQGRARDRATDADP
jgi:hypothetical protein